MDAREKRRTGTVQSEIVKIDERNRGRPCFCGSESSYGQCCQPLHKGTEQPQTALALMRSRYSAYCLGLVDYLVETTHPETRGKRLAERLEQATRDTSWLSLSIIGVEGGQRKHKQGKVAFIAYGIVEGEQRQLQEKSRFKRFRGCWKYLDGKG